MTSTSAIQPLTNKVEDEDDIEFAYEIETIESQVASNLDLDAT
jgi:hypothetical protein